MGYFIRAYSTGQLNTIMTFYQIVESFIPPELLNPPIKILARTARAQIIAVVDGEGVRFLPVTPGR